MKVILMKLTSTNFQTQRNNSELGTAQPQLVLDNFHTLDILKTVNLLDTFSAFDTLKASNFQFFEYL